MLKQDALSQDAVPEPPISVSQARVTPDELSSALAAIEARRQAEAAHLAGTIPIDQAVSELHLDSTSDEIWAEVQAQRTKASATPPAPRVSEAAEAQPPLEALFQRLQERKEAHRRGRIQRRPRGVWSVFAAVMFGWLLLHSGHLRLIPPSITISGTSPIAVPHLRPLSLMVLKSTPMMPRLSKFPKASRRRRSLSAQTQRSIGGASSKPAAMFTCAATLKTQTR